MKHKEDRIFNFAATSSPLTDGAAATIQIGTVTTGAAGSSATVTNSGSSSAATFDFSIPQGAAGSGSSTLSGLTDVTLGTLVNGQVLKYNGSAWINDTDATGGGGGGSTDLLEIMLFT